MLHHKSSGVVLWSDDCDKPPTKEELLGMGLDLPDNDWEDSPEASERGGPEGATEYRYVLQEEVDGVWKYVGTIEGDPPYEIPGWMESRPRLEYGRKDIRY